MTKVTVEDIKSLIESNPSVVEFGSPDDSVDPEWFEKAESVLGVKLPDSYLWFLRNYSGGEVGGEEIFSIYGIEFEEVNGGDIVFQHLMNLKNGLTDPDKLVVLENDFGEVFFFNYSEFDGRECPIFVRLPSGASRIYANDFLEFLYKRIEINIG